MADALQDTAERALSLMRGRGFEQAQVSAVESALTEFNIAANEPSLMRSAVTRRVALAGIVGGRKAACELAAPSEQALAEAVAALFADAQAAPADEAQALSAGQRVHIEQGPVEPDTALLADKLRELLDFRAAVTPATQVEEALAAHTLVRSRTLTSGGSDLACRIGSCSLSAMGTARRDGRVSSFNHAGGETHDLAAHAAPDWFGIGEFMRDAERQIETRALDAPFDGELVLTPRAVASLLGWLQGQVGDERLIARTSLYRERVGEAIASPLLTLQSRFDAPGVAAVSAEAFAAPPVTVLAAGRLATLTPGFYASRRTGLAHVPTAPAGWGIAAGSTPRDEMIAGVARGALVDRLSMGSPAANGDFSGVIKNSFLITGGEVGPALSEVMVSGNMARMLLAVSAVSRERIDSGALCLPWLRIGGLHFS
jgi:PmbA protein